LRVRQGTGVFFFGARKGSGKGRLVRPGESAGDRNLPGNGPHARFVIVFEELVMAIIARLGFGAVRP
jgi:hypothetical protein